MAPKYNIYIKIIAIILVITFCFENILWANPEILKSRGTTDSLQAPTPFNHIVNPQYSHKLLFESYISYIIRSFGSLDKINNPLYPKTPEGIIVNLRFDQKNMTLNLV